jgi:DNA-binding response OmpR family regulator
VKDKEGLLSFGADEVLEKPLGPEALVEHIRKWLAGGRRPASAVVRREPLEPA